MKVHLRAQDAGAPAYVANGLIGLRVPAVPLDGELLPVLQGMSKQP